MQSQEGGVLPGLLFSGTLLAGNIGHSLAAMLHTRLTVIESPRSGCRRYKYIMVHRTNSIWCVHLELRERPDPELSGCTDFCIFLDTDARQAQ